VHIVWEACPRILLQLPAGMTGGMLKAPLEQHSMMQTAGIINIGLLLIGTWLAPSSGLWQQSAFLLVSPMVAGGVSQLQCLA
jgi:hypothetical protein